MVANETDGIKIIEDNFAFQEKSWAFQRISWVILTLLLVAGALGLFGDMGPLANGRASTPDGQLQVEYKQFLQYLSPVHVRIHVDPPETSGDTVRLWIDREYVDAFTLQDMSPQPDRVEVAADRLIYEFPVTEPGQPISITMSMRYMQAGRLSARLGLEDGETVEFWQLVYP
jgi:hypothetical protein